MDKIVLIHHISERIPNTLNDIDALTLNEIDSKDMFDFENSDRYGDKTPDYFFTLKHELDTNVNLYHNLNKTNIILTHNI